MKSRVEMTIEAALRENCKTQEPKLRGGYAFEVKTLDRQEYELELFSRRQGKFLEAAEQYRQSCEDLLFREIEQILLPHLTEREIVYLNKDNIIAAFKFYIERIRKNENIEG